MWRVRSLFYVFTCLIAFGCADGTKFIHVDQNFYWTNEAFVTATPTSGNHVLFIVDDSGTMKTKINELKPSIKFLADELKTKQGRYFVHMVRLSELDYSKATQGQISLKPEFITSGSSEVETALNGWTDQGISREYGIAGLALMIQKLFPQLDDIDDIKDLIPTRHKNYTMVPTLLAPFFNAQGGLLVPKSLDAIKAITDKDTLTNLQTIANNYDYYLYPYLRDQAMGSRQLSYIYPVIISDEDDEGKNQLTPSEDGSRIPLSGKAGKYVYQYHRKFTQEGNMLSKRLCRKNVTIPGGANTATQNYVYTYKHGPYLRENFYCADSMGENGFTTHFDMGADATYQMCNLPSSYDCKTLGPDNQLGPTVTSTAVLSRLWENYLTPFTPNGYCGHGAWMNKAKWAETAARAPSGSGLTYNDICTPSPGSTMIWRVEPNSNCHPNHEFPSSAANLTQPLTCRRLNCQLYLRPAMQAQVVGNQVRITNENTCAADETLITGSGFVEIPGADFEDWENLSPVPAQDAIVRYHVITAIGKIVSDEYWSPEEAPVKIAEILRAREATPGASTDWTKGIYHFAGNGTVNMRLHAGFEEWSYVAAYEQSLSYQPEVITITAQPAPPLGDGTPLYTNAPHFLQWLRENFPDLSIRASAIVKQSDERCFWEAQGSVDSVQGKTYRDLVARTNSPGKVAAMDRDLCEVASSADFNDFMKELSLTVVSGNLQSMEIKGDPNDGVFEVRNITLNQLLQEGVHYEISPEGKHGFVKLFPGAVPPGHQIRVSVTRQ